MMFGGVLITVANCECQVYFNAAWHQSDWQFRESYFRSV